MKIKILFSWRDGGLRLLSYSIFLASIYIGVQVALQIAVLTLWALAEYILPLPSPLYASLAAVVAGHCLYHRYRTTLRERCLRIYNRA